MAKRPVGLKALHVGGAYAPGDSIQLGVVPYDWESDRRGTQRAKVVRSGRFLPEMAGINQPVPADGLLKAGIELIPVAGLQRRTHGAKHVLRQAADSGRAREQKVLVERGFQRPRVGYAQYRSGAFDVVRYTEPRLRAGRFAKAIIPVETETWSERKMSKRNRILHVKRGLVDISGSVILEQLPATGQVVRNQTHIQIRVSRKPKSVALTRIQYGRGTGGVAVGV